MNKWPLILAFPLAVATATCPASAQSTDPANSTLVKHMLSFDKNGDGKLTKDEITDERFVRLFEQADANHDGTVTRDELTALAGKLEAEVPAGGRGGPGGPPDGFDRGPGGPGGFGRGGRGGPPQPGQVLPPMLQDALNLSADQRKQIDELQRDVDARLAKILTPEQLAQLKQMRNRGGGGGPRRGGPPQAPPDRMP